jgi:two-component system chemotaxis sensor kinase CheA
MPTSNDLLAQLRNGFLSEALDLLIELDSALLALESTPDDSTLVNRVFRAIHTIKGSSGVAGLGHLARFTHNVEEAFELAREGKLAITPELIDCALKSCDVIRLILDQTEDAVVAGEAEVASALGVLLKKKPTEVSSAPAKKAAAKRASYQIVFKPNRELFYAGIDPVTLLDELRELGQAHITTHTEQVPPLASLEVEHCYLWWEILLVTEGDLARIKEVFVFVESECDLQISLLEDQAGTVALLGSVPEAMLELFRVECEEQLERVESAALALDQDRQPGRDLDALFRGVHNIKGNTGVLLGQIKGGLVAGHPLQLLHQVTHGLESMLDPFRAMPGEPVPEQIVQTALDTCDAIQRLLKSLRNHTSPRAANVSPALLNQLGIKASAERQADSATPRSVAFLNTTSQWVEMIAGCFEHINGGADLAGPVLDTYLRGVKTLSSAAQYQNFPELEEPLALQLAILDGALRGGGAVGEEERSKLGNAFQSVCSILDNLGKDSEESSKVNISAPSETHESAPAADRVVSSGGPAATIRIEQEKLDRLMRVTGELLVARGAFPILVQKLNNGAEAALVAKELRDAGSNISRITDDLQASIMSIRMLPAKTVFQKFPRLVRDLARSLGKEVRLIIEGESTELDKTILEQIGDPLVHVIRNAVDHGLELPEIREANGKDPCGLLKVRAANEAGGVVIEIIDDGKGLDAEALKRKAVERGLISTDTAANMSEEAAFQLIFMPGLSTAEKVTDISGRGVGMDVVRSNVRNLQGTIEIRSKRGKGTTLLIKLPTSLMISKGILLEAGEQQYILPLGSIRDMVKVPREAAHEYQGMQFAQVRGNTFPLFPLAEVLGLATVRKPELSIAVVEAGSVRYGLIVDRFITEVEVLVKPLTGGLEECREFQGAAIMGDGRVVLVLNALECHGLRKAHAAG